MDNSQAAPAQSAVVPAVDVVLRSATVLTLDGADTCFDGDVAVKDGEIVAIGAALSLQGREEFDLRGQVVLPGFVNAHTHECMERGWFEDLDFIEWLETYALPKDHAYTADHQNAAAHLVQLELIKSGFTSFIDMFRFPSTAAAVVRQSGLRVTFAPQLIEEPSGVGESLETSLAFLDEVAASPHPRIRAWLGPHSLYSCSETTMEQIATIASDRRIGIHTHLAESRAEVARIYERTGLSPAAYLHKLIGLGPHVLLAHGVELSIDDIALIAESGASVAHCPTSNLKLGNRICPVTDLLNAGVTVGLGTDSVMSNNTLDPFSEMRMAALVAKFRTGDTKVLPAKDVLKLAIGGSAKALGLADQVGSIEVGKKADIIAVNLDSPHLWPLLDTDDSLGNLVEQLVYAARASDVSFCMVDGSVLMSDRAVRTLDEASVREMVDTQARDLAHRAGVDHSVIRRGAKTRI
jgi:5-methylthioadenosine/S-adenosylhomocysteine deaminase